jgi:hypothetical protein
MSLGRRPHIGFEVRCDARGCTATTATIVPPTFRRSPVRATEAAIGCGWLQTRIGGETLWACPMHQLWDERLERWVAIPLIFAA